MRGHDSTHLPGERLDLAADAANVSSIEQDAQWHGIRKKAWRFGVAKNIQRIGVLGFGVAKIRAVTNGNGSLCGVPDVVVFV